MSVHNHLFLMFLVSLATEMLSLLHKQPMHFPLLPFVFYVCCCRHSCAWASVLQLNAMCIQVFISFVAYNVFLVSVFGASVSFLMPAASNTLKLENTVDCSWTKNKKQKIKYVIKSLTETFACVILFCQNILVHYLASNTLKLATISSIFYLLKKTYCDQ